MTTNGPDGDADDAGTAAGLRRGDWSDATRPSVQVVEAVAAETDRDAMHLPQLNDFVDPDALDKFLGAAAEKGEGVAHVSFDYDGLRVTVDSTGTVTVEQ